ncbi:MAG: thioredoxin family protein [Patescibacteria group bacterium]|jgi:small redox-active disulfide protein 2
MKIQVFGSGCCSCKTLYELTKQAAKDLKIDSEVEYIVDIQKIIETGWMRMPVLAINEKPVIVGSIPKLEEIKKVIKSSIKES